MCLNLSFCLSYHFVLAIFMMELYFSDILTKCHQYEVVVPVLVVKHADAFLITSLLDSFLHIFM